MTQINNIRVLSETTFQNITTLDDSTLYFIPRITVASYGSGTKGYVRFSNGFTIQYGVLVRSAAKALDSVTLPISMTGNTYSVVCSHNGSDSYEASADFAVSYAVKKTTTGFKLTSTAAITNVSRLSWIVIGY